MIEYLSTSSQNICINDIDKRRDSIRSIISDTLNYDEELIEVKNVLKFALKTKDLEILKYFANPTYLNFFLPDNKSNIIFDYKDIAGIQIYLLRELQKKYKLNYCIMLMLTSITLTEAGYNRYVNKIDNTSPRVRLLIENYRIYNMNKTAENKNIKGILNTFKEIEKLSTELNYPIDSDIYIIAALIHYKNLNNKSKAYNLFLKARDAEPRNYDATYFLTELFPKKFQKVENISFENSFSFTY